MTKKTQTLILYINKDVRGKLIWDSEEELIWRKEMVFFFGLNSTRFCEISLLSLFYTVENVVCVYSL